MINKDTKRRIGIYGTNFLTPSLVDFLKNTPRISEVASKIPGLDELASSANPYGAAFYGTLNIVGRLSDKIKNSRFTRLPQLIGAIYYGANTIVDLFSIAEGNSTLFPNFAFDASMLYQLGKDTLDNYREIDLLDDLINW